MEGDDDDKKKKLLNKAEDTALMLCVGATNAKQWPLAICWCEQLEGVCVSLSKRLLPQLSMEPSRLSTPRWFPRCSQGSIVSILWSSGLAARQNSHSGLGCSSAVLGDSASIASTLIDNIGMWPQYHQWFQPFVSKACWNQHHGLGGQLCVWRLSYSHSARLGQQFNRAHATSIPHSRNFLNPLYQQYWTCFKQCSNCGYIVLKMRLLQQQKLGELLMKRWKIFPNDVMQEIHFCHFRCFLLCKTTHDFLSWILTSINHLSFSTSKSAIFLVSILAWAQKRGERQGC